MISCNGLSSFFYSFLLFPNEVIKHVIAVFILCSFGLNQKNQKLKPKTNAPLFLAANAHEQSLDFVITLFY